MVEINENYYYDEGKVGIGIDLGVNPIMTIAIGSHDNIIKKNIDNIIRYENFYCDDNDENYVAKKTCRKLRDIKSDEDDEVEIKKNFNFKLNIYTEEKRKKLLKKLYTKNLLDLINQYEVSFICIEGITGKTWKKSLEKKGCKKQECDPNCKKEKCEKRELLRAYRQVKIGRLIKCIKKVCKDKKITLIIADKHFASSQICNDCGNYYKPYKGEKDIKCRKCKAYYDKDENAAKNLLVYGLYNYIDDDYYTIKKLEKSYPFLKDEK